MFGTAGTVERGDDPDGCVSVGFQKQDVTRFGLWTAGCVRTMCVSNSIVITPLSRHFH